MINEKQARLGVSEKVAEFINKMGKNDVGTCIAMYTAADTENKIMNKLNEELKVSLEIKEGEIKRLELKNSRMIDVLDHSNDRDLIFKVQYKDYFEDEFYDWDGGMSVALSSATRRALGWAEREFGRDFNKDVGKAKAVYEYIEKVLRESSNAQWVKSNKHNDIRWDRFKEVLLTWVRAVFFRVMEFDRYK